MCINTTAKLHLNDFNGVEKMQAYNIKNARRKIWAGTAVVYLILTVSLGVSIAYWYILAGASNTEDQTIFWTFIIWLVVAVGFTAEIIKKVTISLFRNLSIWGVATFVSILTVMGTYSILDNDKQNELVKQSDGYQLAKSQKQKALEQQSKYAYAQNFNIEDLEAKKRKAGKKARWGTFNRLKKDIEAKRNYLSATNTLNSSTQNMNMGGAGSVSSNPFLTNLAKPLGLSGELLKSLFFLLVTLLLEIGAYWIGGRVEELKQTLELTEAEILDLKLISMYGVSMNELNAGLFANVVQAQIDHIEAEKQIELIRKTSRKKLPVGKAVEQIKQLKNGSHKKQDQAKQPPHPTPKPPPQNPRNFSFGFLPHTKPKSEPKKVQSEPKQVQKYEPKEVQKQPVNLDSKPILRGSKRKTVTPDTGTTGKTANRYRALKKAVQNGKIKPTKRGIKGFKFGGRGMGDSTAKKYREALIKEGVIS